MAHRLIGRGCLLTVAAVGLLGGVPQDGSTPSADVLEAHVRFLAADALRGRAPGTEGYDAGAEYVASHFALLDLEPAGDGATYMQSVPLHSSQRDNEAARRFGLPVPAGALYK